MRSCFWMRSRTSALHQASQAFAFWIKSRSSPTGTNPKHDQIPTLNPFSTFEGNPFSWLLKAICPYKPQLGAKNNEPQSTCSRPWPRPKPQQLRRGPLPVTLCDDESKAQKIFLWHFGWSRVCKSKTLFDLCSREVLKASSCPMIWWFGVTYANCYHCGSPSNFSDLPRKGGFRHGCQTAWMNLPCAWCDVLVWIYSRRY